VISAALGRVWFSASVWSAVALDAAGASPGATMTAAIIGLAGVIMGALMTQIWAIVNDRRQTRHEAERWRRDQLAAAYDGAIRYLLRATNRRSKIFVEGGQIMTVLTAEYVREWFDDLVEAQFWLQTLASRCGAAQCDRIRRAIDSLDDLITSMNPDSAVHTGRPMKADALRSTVNIATQCAGEEVGNSAGMRINR
jgi:hypothetical protein